MANPKFKPQCRRLLFIERELRKGHYPNCSTLALTWEVSARTIHRDMDYLRDELEAPIEYSEARHGYFLSDESWTLQSVVLGEGEVLSLLIGTQVAGMFEGNNQDIAGTIGRDIGGQPGMIGSGTARLARPRIALLSPCSDPNGMCLTEGQHPRE